MAMRRALYATLLVMLTSGGGAVPVSGQIRGDLRQFMRQKLELSKAALEGLTLEDYALIAKSARELKALSMDSQWQVSPNANYLRLSNEFQVQTDDMARKAQAHALDGATLAYVQMTLSCVKCHTLVREQKLISLTR